MSVLIVNVKVFNRMKTAGEVEAGHEHGDDCSERCYLVGHTTSGEELMLVPSVRLNGKDSVTVTRERSRAYEVGGKV